ncbi:MAG: carboxypeptidase-like regulatory domain-containing protein, partial [Planctomycetota bacterium]
VARALSGSDGRFVLEHVAPGRYLLHASLEADGTRHTWDVAIDLGGGQRETLDLTNANRTGAEPLPDYR